MNDDENFMTKLKEIRKVMDKNKTTGTIRFTLEGVGFGKPQIRYILYSIRSVLKRKFPRVVIETREEKMSWLTSVFETKISEIPEDYVLPLSNVLDKTLEEYYEED